MEQKKSSENLFFHLAELRTRLIKVVISIIVCSSLSFIYGDKIFNFLLEPFYISFQGYKIIGTSPSEAFLARLLVGILSGVVLAMPVILYQVWKFIEPGLYPKERKLFLPFIFSTIFLFLLGASFAYLVVVPYAYDFFKQQYLIINVEPVIKLGEHISMLVKIIFGFSIAFQMPIVSFILAKLGFITFRGMVVNFRYVVVGIFIFSAILTPPDVFTQLLMATPMLLLYLTSAIIVKLQENRNEEKL